MASGPCEGLSGAGYAANQRNKTELAEEADRTVNGP